MGQVGAQIPVRMTPMGRLLPAAFEAASVRYRRYRATARCVPERVLLPPRADLAGR